MRPFKIPRYPHFDAPLSQSAAKKLVLNRDEVAKHTFSPLLRRDVRKWKFRNKKITLAMKPNPRRITYAGRRDSVIFRHYRDILSGYYEDILKENGLNDCVLAYRTIPSPGGGGKSNVNFAVEAFDSIRRMGNCTVFCLDIKSFFDNIAHDDVLAIWRRLLKTNFLSADHFAVMKAATQYSFIGEKAALGILGYFGEKQSPSGKKVRGYLKPRKSLPTRLCSRSAFTTKIAKNVTVNQVGIPQGLPISDVLANAVLLDFDCRMKQFCGDAKGVYRRYSDDLLFIVPGISIVPDAFIKSVEEALGSVCMNLKLGHNKTAVYTVDCLNNGDQQVFPVASYKTIPTIDYLGLSYDGTSVYLRQSTLARLKRRIVLRVRRQVLARFRENETATRQEILSRLNLEGIMREFGRIEASHRQSKKPLSRGPQRSFRCYAVRASKACGFKTSKILEQISNLKTFIRMRAEKEIATVRP